MRSFAYAIGPALATLGLLCAVGAHAQADSECQGAFERWAKISAARVVSQGSNGRGACVPSEDVRNGLLDGLALARGICGNASTEQAAQTKTLLHINQSFIAALVICPSPERPERADGGPGWVTRAAPNAEKPKVAAPLVAPPPAPAPSRAPAPSPPLPRSTAAAPPPALAPPPAPAPAPPAAAAGGPPSPPCLDMAPPQNDSVALVNRRCRGHTVLAVIETPGAGGETVCRGYAINYTLAVRAPGARPPRVNFECIAGQGSCSKDRLGDMFPECDW